MTPYTYGPSKNVNCVNIGWLDTTSKTKGFHTCPFCNNERGSTHFTIEGNGKSYCFPKLLTHYISAHGYKPPDEFLDAVKMLKVSETNTKSHYRRSSRRR